MSFFRIYTDLFFVLFYVIVSMALHKWQAVGYTTRKGVKQCRLH